MNFYLIGRKKMKRDTHNPRLRWYIIKIIDKIKPDYCWALLVLWAYYPEHHDFSEMTNSLFRNEGYFRQTCDPNALHCGKCGGKKS